MNATIKDRIFELNDDTLASINCGHVFQIWEDGEITMQKCGDLLWQRILHLVSAGDTTKAIALEHFPHQYHDHAYAFVTEEDAKEIQRAIVG